MKSGWIINFKNGTMAVLNEKEYEKYQLRASKENILSEEHWFDIDKAFENDSELVLAKM